MRIAIIGARANCPHCQNLAKIVGTFPAPAKATAKEIAALEKAAAPFRAWMAGCSGCVVVDADKTTKLYGEYKALSLTKPIADKLPGNAYNWPVVSVFDGTTLKGSFLARNYTAAKLIKKIESLCPSCADTEPGVPTKMKTCPTCKGKGEVPA